MEMQLYISIGGALTALGFIANLSYRAGRQEQRILQLEAGRSAESARLEHLQKIVQETHDAVVRLEARQDAYFHMQEAS